MKKKITRLNKRIIITLWVMIILLTFSCILSKTISGIEEQSCWDELHSSLNNISSEIVSKLSNDRAILDSIADIITGQDSIDSPEIRKIIDGFRPNNGISHIAMLLPGNKVMLPGEPLTDSGELLSFDEEAAKGYHISNRSVDIRDKSRLILRNFVPVEKDGKIIAMLYSAVDLQTLSGYIDLNAYGGKAAIYLIDGSQGNFLLDTWHDTIGNIRDSGKREVKSGYSQEKMLKDVADKRPGHCVFV